MPVVKLLKVVIATIFAGLGILLSFWAIDNARQWHYYQNVLIDHSSAEYHEVTFWIQAPTAVVLLLISGLFTRSLLNSSRRNVNNNDG